MTLNEAISIISERDPSRHYFAEKRVQKQSGEPALAAKYIVSIIPGPNGAACQRFEAQTLENALQAAILALPEAIISDDNNE